MDYQHIREKAIHFMANRGWRTKLAKRQNGEQSLFEHTLKMLDALLVLMPILDPVSRYGLNSHEKQTLIVGLLAHDAGKERDEWQYYIHNPSYAYVPHIIPEHTDKIVRGITEYVGFDSTLVSDAKIIVNQHMKGNRTTANVLLDLMTDHASPRFKTLAEIVDVIDNVCSCSTLQTSVQALDKSIFSKYIQVTCHRVQIRGLSTTFIHKAATDAFAAHNWQPLLYYSDGTVYIADAAAPCTIPALSEIENSLAEALAPAMAIDYQELVVGSPVESMIPKPELFHYTEIGEYLRTAQSKAGRTGFQKKPLEKQHEVVASYCKLKGCHTDKLSDFDIMRHAGRIGQAHPQMVMFKFFKAAISKERLTCKGLLTEQEIQTINEKCQRTAKDEEKYQKTFAKEKAKAEKAAWQAVEQFITGKYEAMFGKGAYRDLKGTSTLAPAKDMAMTIDYYWNLPGQVFGRDVTRIESLSADEQEKVLQECLTQLALEIYHYLPEQFRPQRIQPSDLARVFMSDLLVPARKIDLAALASEQLHIYSQSKNAAKKSAGEHVCPVCNQHFGEAEEAKADYLSNPEAHTNRAVAHSGAGYIVICDSCKYERFLQQMVLKGMKAPGMMVIVPRLGIGRDTGSMLTDAAQHLQRQGERILQGDELLSGKHMSLSFTDMIASKLTLGELAYFDSVKLGELLTYRTSKSKLETQRKELEKFLIEEMGSLDEINETYGTQFTNWAELRDAVIDKTFNQMDTNKLRDRAFKLWPSFTIVVQTPNMIFVPLSSPIAMGKDSDVNGAIRELFVMSLISLCFDCAVAIADDGDVIDFTGGEGAVRLPSVAALRALVGAWRQARKRFDEHQPDWLQREEAEVWVTAIAAASQLANDAGYSERSNLYQVLSASSAGALLSRIEQQGKGAGTRHIELLEQLKEVLV